MQLQAWHAHINRELSAAAALMVLPAVPQGHAEVVQVALSDEEPSAQQEFK